MQTALLSTLVSDAQSAYARAELRQVGLLDYFDPIIVSGEHGFPKPDRRLFTMALDRLGVDPEHVLYVGNDMKRDVRGAGRVGMRTVMFDSDQGRKAYRGCSPDFTITDHRSCWRSSVSSQTLLIDVQSAVEIPACRPAQCTLGTHDC